MSKFIKRPKGIGIIYGHSGYVPGKRLQMGLPIEEADILILHYNDRSVLVKNILKKADGTFSGTILGFEPPAMGVGDLKSDDSITFTEDEVFSASFGKEVRIKVAITIDRDILEKVDILAQALNLNRSRMVENLLGMALDDTDALKSMGLLELAKIVQRVKTTVYPSRLKSA